MQPRNILKTRIFDGNLKKYTYFMLSSGSARGYIIIFLSDYFSLLIYFYSNLYFGFSGSSENGSTHPISIKSFICCGFSEVKISCNSYFFRFNFSICP